MGHRAKEIRKIKTTTINKILEDSKFKGLNIDFLSIDVEGHELDVIKGLDFKNILQKLLL